MTTHSRPLPHVLSPTWRPPRAIVFEAELREVLFVLAHLPLGLVLRSFPLLVDLHTLVVVGLGVFWSTRQATVHSTVLAAGYVTGAEVLWRMCGGAVFYEFGKYAVTLLLLCALLGMRRRHRGGILPLLYLALLLASVPLTLSALGVTEEARQQISFNMSGPLALAVCAFFFLGTSASSVDIRRLVLAVMAPIAGISAIAGRSTLTAERIVFSGESNLVTSGGFGPNQVSAVLGLGAVLLVLFAFQTRTPLWRLCLVGLGMVFLTQAILTFSRGGVANAVLCFGLLGVHFLRARRARVAFFVTVVLVSFVGTQLVFPALDEWTGGSLSERYTDLDPDTRRSLAEKELQIWKENPVLGVGPGMAKDHRRSFFRGDVAAHTEYTRLLAEHGSVGLLAGLVLLVLAAQAYLRAPTAMTKAWVAILAGWSILEMSHAAMRIAAISFAFGLAMIRWEPPRPRRAPPRGGRTPPAGRAAPAAGRRWSA